MIDGTGVFYAEGACHAENLAYRRGNVKIKDLTLRCFLALTIMLETGPISRFQQAGNYASYCRKVSSKWISNDKKKRKGNKKSGNKYLAWAFSEAAELARRFHDEPRAYYNRKMQRTNFMTAHAALAHKLARAAYYIMRDNVPFASEKLFA